MPGYKPYPKYSSDGVPMAWAKKRLRFALQMNPSKNEICLADDDRVSFVPMDAVGEYGGIRLSEEKELSEIGSGYTYFCDGDVVVAKITPCFENGKSALAKGMTNKTAFGTTELHVLRADRQQIDPCFLFYLTISDLFRKLGESEMYGASGQKRVPETFIKDFRAALPSLEEQQAIARFLDFKTAQIDTLIAKKQTLLEKLAEKRTALISHAVTKGLDSTVTMTDTGVEWLGEIPVHWKEVGLTKYIDSQVDYRGKTPEKTKDGVFLVTARNVKNGKIDYSLSQEYVAEDQYDEIMGRGAPQISDVVFTTEAPLGEVANIDDPEIALAQRIIKFRGRRNVLDNYFLKYWIMGSLFQQHLYSLCTGSTALGIKASKLCLLRLALPPIEEQYAIVKHLDIVNKDFYRQSGLVEQVISRLIEYRSALLTNAVTGKIDVRNFPMPSPTSKEVSHA